jgi:hypothetical protein
MPYRPHSEYRSPLAPPPRQSRAGKERPSAAWFVVGTALLAVAVAFVVISVHRYTHTLGDPDVEFVGDGTHRVTVPANVERAVFVDSERGGIRCSAAHGTGAAVTLLRPLGTATYGPWTEVATFDTGDGNLTFTCHGAVGAGRVRVQAPPSLELMTSLSIGSWVGLYVGVPGLVILVITGVLWVKRRPRPEGRG